MIRKISLSLLVGLVGVSIACGGGRMGAGTAATATFARTSFHAGIAHVAGNYGFTEENYLLEGAEQIQKLGSKSIFVYLTQHYRDQYPDRSAGMWGSNPSSLVQLAQTTPYAKLFGCRLRLSSSVRTRSLTMGRLME